MIMRYVSLRRWPVAFEKLTGLGVAEFDELLDVVQPLYCAAERRRHMRPDRKRAIGGGDQMQLGVEDQLLLTLVWQRHYPRQDVLGHFFGISQPTVWRCTARILPLLLDCGLEVGPDPGRKQRQTMAELMHEVPELADLVGAYLHLNRQRAGR